MGGWMRWAVGAVVAGVVAAGAAGAASAATRQMTFSGQLVSLSDATHLFGPVALGDLADKSFSAVFTFDLPSAGETKAGGADILAGGSQIFRPAFVSGRLSFAGVTHVFAGERFGSVGIGGGAAGASLRGLAGGGGLETLDLNANVTPLPVGDLGVDFVGTQALADTGSGFRAWNSAGGGGEALGVLFIDRVTLGDAVAATVGVPEPAGWALMIGGFGMAGAGLRRRGRVVDPSQAA